MVLDLNRNRFAALAAVLWFAAAAPGALGRAPADGPGQALVQEVLGRFATAEPTALLAAAAGSPSVEAAVARWDAARAAVAGAATLPDPRLGYTENLQPIQTRLGAQTRTLSLQQPLPWFGTLGLQARVEDRAAAAAACEVESAVLSAVTRVRVAWHRWRQLLEAEALMQDHLELVQQLEAVARQDYAAGTGGLPAVLQAQMELGRLRDRISSLADRREPLLAAIRAEVGDVALSEPASLFGDPEPAGDLDPRFLEELLAARNPALRAWELRREGSAAAVSLAGKHGLPSFILGLQYQQVDPRPDFMDPDNGQDAFGVSVQLSMPLWRGRVRSERDRALAGLTAADASRSALERQLRTELHEILADSRDAARSFDLNASTLLPLGRSALGAVRTSYEAGKADFDAVIDAQRDLLDFEIAVSRARADVLITRARLEGLLAGPLPGSPAGEPKGE